LTRGEVVLVNLDPAIGSEPKKNRPCVVVQNDVSNKYSPNTIIIALTSRENITKLMPVMVEIPQGESGLANDSVADAESVRLISKQRIVKIYGSLSSERMAEIDIALKRALSL